MSSYIDQIETGGGDSGGSGFNCVENVTRNKWSVKNSFIYNEVIMDDTPTLNFKFTPKIDNAHLFILSNSNITITPNVEENTPHGRTLEKGTEYHLTAEDFYSGGSIIIVDYNGRVSEEHSPIDAFIFNYN